jgi:hypothetical protein
MAKLTGGGIQSSKRVEVGLRTGSRSADKASPRGVSQLGISQGGRLRQEGSHTSKPSGSPMYEGTKPSPVELGNSKARDVGGGGVGTGRTIYPSGFQSLHGQPVQGSTPASRDTLAEYGPESDQVRRR